MKLYRGIKAAEAYLVGSAEFAPVTMGFDLTHLHVAA